MSGWNFADVFERIADTRGDAPAQHMGDRTATWSEFDRRADGIARTLLDRGAGRQDKVALYLYNCPEYLEACFGAFKAALVPFNTNYRYTDTELVYLWTNADAAAVVFVGSFVETIERIRGSLPTVETWLWVDDGTASCPEWAIDYEVAAASSTERVRAPGGRSGEDLLMLYTGGTTGMPKGVMWRQQDLFGALVVALQPQLAGDQDLELLEATALAAPMATLPACPLMHGTGWFTALIMLSGGGSVTSLTNRSIDVAEMLDTVESRRINSLIIVGDTFARPIVAALDAEPDRWDLSSLLVITSSGVMWSHEVKQQMLAHQPGMLLVDSLGSSEAVGLGSSISGGDAAAATASFSLGDNAIVVADDGTLLEPGDGRTGRVAVGGYTPIGYYKDPEKSAATFIEIDGRTFSMPGDYASITPEGELQLLGRGSVCINTGGEKVFPEEVEEALKRDDTIVDAIVVGVPDDRFGQMVVGIVEMADGAELDIERVLTTIRTDIAPYKAPRRILVVDTIGRAPNAKVDYKRHTAYAVQSILGGGDSGATG